MTLNNDIRKIHDEETLNDAFSARLGNTHVRRFLFAGRAYFTIRNPKSGVHLTYKVVQGKPGKWCECPRCKGMGIVKFQTSLANGRCFFCDGTGTVGGDEERPAPYFVHWLTGSNSEGSAAYAYIGYVTPEEAAAPRPRLRPGKSLERISEAHVARRAFAWLLRHLDLLPFLVEFHHAGRCGHCARRLTDPASIAAGLGPACRKKLGVEVVASSKTAVAAGLGQTRDVEIAAA